MIYFLRGMAAFVQLIVIYSLYRISPNTLGVYSFNVAILAILLQIVAFEGYQYAISGTIEVAELKKIFSTTSMIWICGLIGLALFSFQEPIAMFFVLVMAANMTAEWVVNFLTAGERAKGKTKTFNLKYRYKILATEISLPLIAVLICYFAGDTVAVILTPLLLFGISIVLYLSMGFPRSFQDFRFPRFSFLHGVVVKRLDSMFIRLFVGAVFGTLTLGLMQPLLSIGRVPTFFTPTWINLNLSTHIRKSSLDKAVLWKVCRMMLGSYILYAIFAAGVFGASKYTDNFSYTFLQILSVCLFFGNQNSKAVFRAISIAQQKFVNNNVILTGGLVGKLVLSFLTYRYSEYSVVISCVIVDFIVIVLNGFSTAKTFGDNKQLLR